MSNDKDFKVKKGVKPTVYHEKLGTVVVPEGLGYDLSSASYDNKSFSVSAQASAPISSFVKNDGTKMYILQSGGALYQYSLSTPHDVSTASYDSVSFSFSSQDTNPISITFKPDGTKMYMGGNTTDSIYQYSLSTPWSINTASYDSKSKNISAQGPYPIGLDFKPDGTIMIMCDGDEINQYTLSTAWDVSTATYVANINAKDQDTQPHSVKFNADGTSYFLTVATTPRVLQYNMSSAYTVSTSTYSGISLSVASEIYPRSSVFSNDGKKLYVVGTNTDTVYQYSTVLTINTLDLSTGSVFQLTPSSNIQLNLSNPAASGTVSGATLLLGGVVTSTYDLANASYDSVDLTVASSNVTGLYFKADGSSFYVAKGTGSNLYRYDMTTAWDLSTGTLGQTYDYDLASGYIAGGDARGIFFKPDGLKYYVLSGTNDQVCEITVTTPWSLSVGFSLTDTFSVSGQDTQPYGLFFKPDGTKMYVTGYTNDRVYQYTLSTAWDLSTASYDSVSFSFASQEGTPENVVLTDDGLTMFMLGSTDVVFKYTLSTAWNVSTASYSGISFSVNSQDTAAKGFYFKAGGEKLYVAGDTNNKIYQYSTATPATITYDPAIQWAGGTAPTSPAIGETDVITFTTRDGGTTYKAALAIDGAA